MRTMYDAITPSRIPTSNPQLVAGYVGGNWPSYGEVVKRFPNAVHLSIAVNDTEVAECLDCEQFDATIQQCPAWVHARRAEGIDPSIYIQGSNWSLLRQAFHIAGIAEPHYWVAIWDGIASVPPGAMAKQYENTPGYDLSAVADHWPGVDKAAPNPHPSPAPDPDRKIVVTRWPSQDSTLSGIANHYGVTLAALEAENPQITNPNLIFPGEVITIP